MVARICDLQRKQKHHHKAKSVLPRAVPFWASAKTISVRDICGESVAAERDDDQDTVEDFEEPVADEYTVSKSKYSILGQLEEWDLSKLKSEYSNHEAEMYSKLSGRLSRATKFDVAVQKIVPSRIIRDPRPPLLNSKYIVPSSKKTRTICTDKMKKRDSAATLAELEVYIEQSGAGNYMGKELDNEIEDGLGQTHADEEYRNAAEQFIGKRSVLFARDIHTSALLSKSTKSRIRLLDESADSTNLFDAFHLEEEDTEIVKTFTSAPLRKSIKLGRK